MFLVDFYSVYFFPHLFGCHWLCRQLTLLTVFDWFMGGCVCWVRVLLFATNRCAETVFEKWNV